MRPLACTHYHSGAYCSSTIINLLVMLDVTAGPIVYYAYTDEP